MTEEQKYITISTTDLGQQLAQMARTAEDMKIAELASQLNIYMVIAAAEKVHPAFLDGLKAAASIIAGSGQIIETKMEDPA